MTRFAGEMMADTYDYPEMIDYWWLASDAVGNVAVLISAGMGAIPEQCFDPSQPATLWPPHEEDHLLTRPPITHAVWQDGVISKLQAEYVARGLFIYEWTDIYRATAEFRRTYEIQLIPGTARNISDFYQDALSLGQIPNFPTIEFSRTPSLDVLSLVPCVVSEQM